MASWGKDLILQSNWLFHGCDAVSENENERIKKTNS